MEPKPRRGREYVMFIMFLDHESDLRKHPFCLASSLARLCFRENYSGSYFFWLLQNNTENFKTQRAPIQPRHPARCLPCKFSVNQMVWDSLIWDTLRGVCYCCEMNETYSSSRKWEGIPGAAIGPFPSGFLKGLFILLLSPGDKQVLGVSGVTLGRPAPNTAKTKALFLMAFTRLLP